VGGVTSPLALPSWRNPHKRRYQEWVNNPRIETVERAGFSACVLAWGWWLTRPCPKERDIKRLNRQSFDRPVDRHLSG
jgi:hypothetical protein